ncbi:amylo-Alpha-1,6-Glucosidase [Arthrobacter sp. Hiyo1]|nr:amylo-Alpha-1,6-Glucosidase [Arthrobacter sp. Hiyo1]
MAEWNADNLAGSPVLGAITLVDGSSFCISLPNGDVLPHHPHGVFYRDTRILSRWCLAVNGEPLEALGAWTPSPFQGTYLGRAAGDVGRADSTMTVERKRMVGAGIIEHITIHNYFREPTRCEVRLSVDADFADLFEVKGGRFHRHWEKLRLHERDEVRIEAVWQDVRKGVTVHAPGCTVDAEGVSYQMLIPAYGEWSVRLVVVPSVEEDNAEDIAQLLHSTPDSPSPQELRKKAWVETLSVLSIENRSVENTILRSRDDIGALRIVDPQRPDRMVVAAGAPWFMALFGRDSLLASFMVLPVDASLALGTLQTLAERQGSVVDPRTEEQPGKILHEVRFGVNMGVALAGKSAYYGTVDATPLFVTLLGEVTRWGVAPEDVAMLLPHADRALDWIREYGDRDGDGFVEYERLNKQGLVNQGWKDSWMASILLTAAPRNLRLLCVRCRATCTPPTLRGRG